MTHIFPARSQNIGFAPNVRTLARRLDSEFDGFEVARQAEKISKPDQKKGG
jgi:hypothetical protein